MNRTRITVNAFVLIAAVSFLFQITFAEAQEAPAYTIQLDTAVEHDDGEFLWFHPRVTAIPQGGRDGQPAILMTVQKHLQVSDFYSGLYSMRTDDLGKTWTGPTEIPELVWRDGPGGTIRAVCDVTPGYHPITGKVLAIGAQLYYRPDGSLYEDEARSDQTAYALYDPKTDTWTGWRVLEMPDEPKFHFSRNACAQWLIEPNGNLLLPLYYGTDGQKDYSATVARCAFDGEELTYLEHGTEMTFEGGRGLCEPSLARLDDRFYLTLRNDNGGYVTSGTDGIHFDPITPWLFDDGQELGSYNTQQHWVTHSDALFLVYTRRGADNDHIMRHRAPLFIAQVDTDNLCVLRASERVLIPERGATLGNFGAANVSEHESWVTVNEGIWNDEMRTRGATGALFCARIQWESPNLAVRFPYPSLPPLFTLVDLDVGEELSLPLQDGSTVDLAVLGLDETRDPIRDAVRRADVTLRVGEDETTLTAGLYNRPVEVDGVLVDAPITQGYNKGAAEDYWGLRKEIRLRLWPKGSPLMEPDSFLYPIDQLWHSSHTWFDNEPVDGGASISKTVYYHAGIDLGAVEGQTRVLAACDCLVVSARGQNLSGFTEDTPIKSRADVLYLYDERGWFYRYSHFSHIDEGVQLGDYVKKGTFLGLVGKEGASGGWSHLHFEIKCRQPSGAWGTLPSHALIREAYINQYQPEILACARQRHLIMPGDTITLDGSHSWTAADAINSYEWQFTDGETAVGEKVERQYLQPGKFEELLKITDSRGAVDYDFAIVHVLNPENPERYMPSLHVAYTPTFNLKAGDRITFSVRAFGFKDGSEMWDFGDGSAPVYTQSGKNPDPQAPDGYTMLEHRYEQPGDYIVKVKRENDSGYAAYTHLHVKIIP
ncbi:MAG: PKD domain-containing protein [Candidatus Hydrogenedentales bacterium]|jgi:murein DD-endopeptidase MepM/ murein hydrolase activator NlpD